MQRRLLTWLAGAAGAAFVVSRRLRRRRAVASGPAAELRRKLDATRAPGTPERESDPVLEPRGAEERRREVYERGRAAIREMRGRSPSEKAGG